MKYASQWEEKESHQHSPEDAPLTSSEKRFHQELKTPLKSTQQQYKRALSRWGIDELYSSPRIQIPDDGYGNSGYRVTEISYNDQRDITHLVIANRFGKEVFRWDNNQTYAHPEQPQNPETSDDSKMSIIQSLRNSANIEYRKEGTNQEELRKFVAFYTNKIERDGWTGNHFDFAKLFGSWMSRVRN